VESANIQYYPNPNFTIELVLRSMEILDNLYHIINTQKLVQINLNYLIIHRVILYIGTFHNILAISWRSVLLVEETRVPGENHNLPLTNFSPLCCIKDTLSCASFEFTTLVVIGTDCTGGCKSNYYTITTMTTPSYLRK
jgi:hypothetical protein